MKFVDSPLRNRMADALLQARLFVKFNFVNFGADGLIPPAVRTLKDAFQYHFATPVNMESEEQGTGEEAVDPLDTPACEFLLFGGAVLHDGCDDE